MSRPSAVGGHHYALVLVTGPRAGGTTPYEVRLDGARVWPQDRRRFRRRSSAPTTPGAPVGSHVRLLPRVRPHEVAVLAAQGGAPRGPRGRRAAGAGRCRCAAATRRVAARARPARRPGLRRRGLARDRRANPRAARLTVPPGESIADFEEYTRLYRESWCEPYVRWLLSTVPTAMIFDDHDVHDDWNTSRTWVEEMRATGWWDERIVGGFASYWLYQHLGNLAPEHLAEDALYRALRDGRRRRRRSCASSRSAPTARSRARAGASAATSGRRGSS